MFNIIDMTNDLSYNAKSGLFRRTLMIWKKHITDAIRKINRILSVIAQVGDVLMQESVVLFR